MHLKHLPRVNSTCSACVGRTRLGGDMDELGRLTCRDRYIVNFCHGDDVFLWTGLESSECLGELMHTSIAAIDSVQRTETFIN